MHSERSSDDEEMDRSSQGRSVMEEIRAEHQPWLDKHGGFRRQHSLSYMSKERRPVTAPFSSLPSKLLSGERQWHGDTGIDGDYLLEYTRDRPRTSPEKRHGRRPHYVITERTPSGKTRLVVAGLDDSLSPSSRDHTWNVPHPTSAKSTDRSSRFSTTSRLTTASEAERKRERGKELKRMNSSLHSMMIGASRLWKAAHTKPSSPSLSQQSLRSETDRSERSMKVPTPELSRMSGWRSGLVSRVLLEEPIAFDTTNKQRVQVLSSCSADPECKFINQPLKPETSHEIGMPKAPSSFTPYGRTPALFGMSSLAQRPIRVQDTTTLFLGTSTSFPSLDIVGSSLPPRLEALRHQKSSSSTRSSSARTPSMENELPQRTPHRVLQPEPLEFGAITSPSEPTVLITTSPKPDIWRKPSEPDLPDMDHVLGVTCADAAPSLSAEASAVGSEAAEREREAQETPETETDIARRDLPEGEELQREVAEGEEPLEKLVDRLAMIDVAEI